MGRGGMYARGGCAGARLVVQDVRARSSTVRTSQFVLPDHLLCNEPAHYHVAHAERFCCLMHSQPQPLIRRRTCREALRMANVLHTLLRPRVVIAGAIAQPIQDRNNRGVFTDQSELANQLRYFLGVDEVVIASLVLPHGEFRVGSLRPSGA
jgi:hypothetical protein